MSKMRIVTVLTFLFVLSIFNFSGEISAKEIKRELISINKSVKDNGITFKITDVFKDGEERLSIEYVIKSEKALKYDKYDVVEKPDVYINGKLINHSNTISSNKISDKEVRGLIEIMPQKEFPKKFVVKFNLNQVLNQSGQWTIKFSL